MSLVQFVRDYHVGERGKGRNLTRTKQKKPTVTKFLPRFSHTSTGVQYVEYCKYSLTKYKPSRGKSLSCSWGGDDATDDGIKATWDDFVDQLLQNGDDVPDMLSREIRSRKMERISNRKRKRGEHGYVSDTDDKDNEDNDNSDDDLQEDWMEAAGAAPVQDLMYSIDADADGTAPISWASDHDWSDLQHNYPVDFRETFPTTFNDMVKNHERVDNREKVTSERLNAKQKLAHDMILESCLPCDNNNHSIIQTRTIQSRIQYQNSSFFVEWVAPASRSLSMPLCTASFNRALTNTTT